MRFAKKVVLAVGLKDNLIELMNPLRHLEFLVQSEIHFVHVFNTVSFSVMYSDYALTFPVTTDRLKIEENVLSQLEKKSKEVLPGNFDGKLIFKCLFDENPKERFCQYVEEVNANLVIVPTRKRRGLFESSFAQFVSKNTHANMIFLKF